MTKLFKWISDIVNRKKFTNISITRLKVEKCRFAMVKETGNVARIYVEVF